MPLTQTTSFQWSYFKLSLRFFSRFFVHEDIPFHGAFKPFAASSVNNSIDFNLLYRFLLGGLSSICFRSWTNLSTMDIYYGANKVIRDHFAHLRNIALKTVKNPANHFGFVCTLGQKGFSSSFSSSKTVLFSISLPCFSLLISFSYYSLNSICFMK